MRRPVRKVTIIHKNPEIAESYNSFSNYYHTEMNALSIDQSDEVEKYFKYDINFNHRSLGQRLGRGYTKELRDGIMSMTNDDINTLLNSQEININGTVIYPEDVSLHKIFRSDLVSQEGIKGITDEEYAILVDFTEDEEIRQSFVAREFINKIQKFKKDLNINIDDDIEIYYSTESENLLGTFQTQKKNIEENVFKKVLLLEDQGHADQLEHNKIEIEGEEVDIYIRRK